MAEIRERFTSEAAYEDSSLKGCPFCGFKTAKRYVIHEHILRDKETFVRTWWQVGCPACGVMTARAANPELATSDWNIRSE